MTLRDGMPTIWRVTALYVTAATVLTLVIVAADYRSTAIIAGELSEVKLELKTLKELSCERSQ